MTIGIIDADLIGRSKHRFPNLACMKISSYYKSQGHEVRLLTSYDDIENYEKVFISKVFTETPVPDGILNLSWVEHGGTGFFYDKAPPLPYEIEHSMPDYKGMYITIARWCNQPSFIKKKSFREFVQAAEQRGEKAVVRYMTEFEKYHPLIADTYFDMKWKEN